MGLFTTAAPAAKFVKVGDSVEGEIVEIYRAQRYEFVRNGIGQPLYWSNRKPTPGARIDPATGKKNDPVLQYVITVETGIADEDGNTERRIFAKNKRMEDGLKKAVIAAKAREGLLLGGRLSCTYTGDDEKSDAPQLPKMYEFVYTAPAAGEGRDPGNEVRLADRDEEDQVDLHQFMAAQAPATTSAPVAYREPVLTGVTSSVGSTTSALGIKDTSTDEPPF